MKTKQTEIKRYMAGGMALAVLFSSASAIVLSTTDAAAEPVIGDNPQIIPAGAGDPTAPDPALTPMLAQAQAMLPQTAAADLASEKLDYIPTPGQEDPIYEHSDEEELDGMSDYLLEEDIELPSGDFTLAAWVNLNWILEFQAVMVLQGESGITFEFDIDETGRLFVWSDDVLVLAGDTAIVEEEWTHLSLTRDSGNLTAYVDGIEDGTGWDGHGMDGFGRLLVGADTDSGYDDFEDSLNGHLDGKVKDVRVYDRVLSEVEIAVLATPQADLPDKGKDKDDNGGGPKDKDTDKGGNHSGPGPSFRSDPVVRTGSDASSGRSLRRDSLNFTSWVMMTRFGFLSGFDRELQSDTYLTALSRFLLSGSTVGGSESEKERLRRQELLRFLQGQLALGEL